MELHPGILNRFTLSYINIVSTINNDSYISYYRELKNRREEEIERRESSYQYADERECYVLTTESKYIQYLPTKPLNEKIQNSSLHIRQIDEQRLSFEPNCIKYLIVNKNEVYRLIKDLGQASLRFSQDKISSIVAIILTY